MLVLTQKECAGTTSNQCKGWTKNGQRQVHCVACHADDLLIMQGLPHVSWNTQNNSLQC